MRDLNWISVGIALLLLTGCGGPQSDAVPTTSAPPTTVEVSTPPTTSAPPTTVEVSTPPTTSAPPTTVEVSTPPTTPNTNTTPNDGPAESAALSEFDKCLERAMKDAHNDKKLLKELADTCEPYGAPKITDEDLVEAWEAECALELKKSHPELFESDDPEQYMHDPDVIAACE